MMAARVSNSASAWALDVFLLALLVVGTFGWTLGHDFVWDDHEQVVDNLSLRSWESAGSFFGTDVLSTTREDGSRSVYYRPLFFLQYLLLFQVLGLATVQWHLAAVVAHIACVWCCLFFLQQLQFSRAVRLFAAALFAVHPVHAESVAWVAAAFNDPPVGALLFAGLALNCGALGRRLVPLITSMLLFLLALYVIEDGRT